MIAVGAQAPDFTSEDDEGNAFRLSGLRGRPVVLHFFALAWSGVCAGELARLGEIVPALSALGAEVVGVSCDSRMTLAAWRRAMSYLPEMKLVADFWPHGEIGRRYGVFDPDLGMDLRGTFVIDAQGIVADVIEADLGRARDIETYVGSVERVQGAEVT